MKFKISTITFLLAFLCSAQFIAAQGGCFRNSFSASSSAFEFGRDIMQDSYGDVLMLGDVGFGARGEITLTKTDNQGATKFSLLYGTDPTGLSGPHEEKAIGIVESSEGDGYVILGSTDFDGDIDIYLFKVALDGTPVWSRIIGTDYDNYPADIIRTADGNYVVVSTISSDSTLGWEIYAMKVSGSGGILWETTVGGEYSESPSSVVELANGTLVIAGTKNDYIGRDQDMFFVNLASDGTYQNSFCLGTTGYDEGTKDIVKGASGSLMVLGFHIAGAGSQDMLITKINSSGTSFSRKIGQPSRQDFGKELIKTANGKYAVAAQIGAAPIGGIASWDAYLLRLNANGSIIGSNRFGAASNSEGFQAVAEANNGSYLLYGYTRDSDFGTWDHYFVAANSLGQSGCCDLGPVGEEAEYTMTDYSYGEEMEVTTTQSSALFSTAAGTMIPICTPKRDVADLLATEGQAVALYPNPSSGTFQLDIPETYLNGQVTISNTLGQVVFQQILTSPQSTLKLDDQQAGVYLLHIQKGEHQLTKRLILN